MKYNSRLRNEKKSFIGTGKLFEFALNKGTEKNSFVLSKNLKIGICKKANTFL